MTLRIRLAIGGLIVALILGFGIRQCRQQQVVTKVTQQADAKHAEVVQEAQKGAEHDQKAEAISPELKALRAEVARLRRVAAPALAVGAPKNPLAPVVSAQDRVIQSLDVHDTEMTEARDSWRASATASQEEAKQLRVALDHTPKFRPLAVGILYGTDQSVGAWVEYDIGRLRVGVDVVRRPIDSTSSRTSVEAVGRVGWRF